MISPFPCACGCCAPGYTDTCFSFPFHVVTLADAMRSLDISRITWPVSLIRMFPFLSHMTLTVLVCVMATCLDSSLSCLRFLAYASYSSPAMTTRLSPAMTTRLSPAMMTRLSPGSRYTHMLPGWLVSGLSLRFVCISVLYSYGSYACLYLYPTDLYIYWVGDGTLPIFNLLCNHPSVVT